MSLKWRTNPPFENRVASSGQLFLFSYSLPINLSCGLPIFCCAYDWGVSGKTPPKLEGRVIWTLHDIGLRTCKHQSISQL